MAATAEEAALAAAEEAERLAVIANEKRAAALALRETTKNRNAAAVSPAHVSASFSSDAAIYAVAALLASVVEQSIAEQQLELTNSPPPRKLSLIHI